MRDLIQVSDLVKQSAGAMNSLSFTVCEHSLSQLLAIGQISEKFGYGMRLSGIHDSDVETFRESLRDRLVRDLCKMIEKDGEVLNVSVRVKPLDIFNEYSERMIWMNLEFRQNVQPVDPYELTLGEIA